MLHHEKECVAVFFFCLNYQKEKNFAEFLSLLEHDAREWMKMHSRNPHRRTEKALQFVGGGGKLWAFYSLSVSRFVNEERADFGENLFRAFDGKCSTLFHTEYPHGIVVLFTWKMLLLFVFVRLQRIRNNSVMLSGTAASITTAAAVSTVLVLSCWNHHQYHLDGVNGMFVSLNRSLDKREIESVTNVNATESFVFCIEHSQNYMASI